MTYSNVILLFEDIRRCTVKSTDTAHIHVITSSGRDLYSIFLFVRNQVDWIGKAEIRSQIRSSSIESDTN